jgi:hypothetical protein
MSILRAEEVFLLLWLSAGAAAAQAQSLDLPAGNVQAKVQTACTECHDASIIRQQRLGEKSWTKEVDKMIKWGAFVDPSDRAAFIEYLSASFPPDKPPDPAVRISRSKTR